MHDLRSAIRNLRKSPGFSVVAVATLAVSIGVNSAMFSLINGLLLKPVVPVRPEEVVAVFTGRHDAERDYRQFSYAEYEALKAEHETFADVAAINFLLAGVSREEGELRRSFAFLISENYFSMMGVSPAAGRFFTADETRPNANVPVVVASYSLWQRFGGRPDFVGSTLRINNEPCTVIGVSPPRFSGVSAAFAPEIWLPLGMHGLVSRSFGSEATVVDLRNPKAYALNVMARLQPGLTLEAARARLPSISAHVAAVQPADDAVARDVRLFVPTRFSISTEPSQDSSMTLFGVLLMGMTAIVLLVACINLANLLLARGTGRSREMAVRLAVGATRWRIVRQLLVESMLLALVGGAAGLLLSSWAHILLERSFNVLLSSINFSLTADLQPDLRAIAVTFGFCVLATLLFSLGPALKAARTDVITDLKASGADATSAGRGHRFFAPRHLLVMAQMTLSLVLIFSAGLFFRAALAAGGLDTGFDPHGVVLTEVDFSVANAPREEGIRRIEALASHLRGLPGVQAVGFTSLLPYSNVGDSARVVAVDAAIAATEEERKRAGAGGMFGAITPGYLDAIGVARLRGRDFTELEARDPAAPRVAIVDTTLAEKLFPNDDALGRRIRYTEKPADGSPAEMEIVGVVAAHRHQPSNNEAAEPHLFVPLAQNYRATGFVATRLANGGRAATLAALPRLRDELRTIDPDLPVIEHLPFTEKMDRSIILWVVRLGAVIFGLFGLIALLLAVIGIYGVRAHLVELRTREIGIRMALGADRRSIFALILRQGMVQTACALLAGVGFSLLIGRALATLLFRVSPFDPVTLGVACVALGTAAFLACWFPARRATRVNPNAALRAE